MKSLSVQFSGSAVIYPYIINESAHIIPAAVGMRVVVPTKIKNDGSLTLTIGNIIAVHDEVIAGASKPIIELLRPSMIESATLITKQLEAGLTPIDKTSGNLQDAIASARGDNQPGAY